MATNPKTQYYRPGGWDTTTVDVGIHPDGQVIAKKGSLDTPLAPLHVETRVLITESGETPTRIAGTGLDIAARTPSIIIDEVDAGVDLKVWQLRAAGGELQLRRLNDVSGAQAAILTIDASGNLGINEPSPDADLDIGAAGILALLESVEPPATSGKGKFWCEADGTFWFQDPAQGDPHLVVGPAYNIMRFHGIADHTLTIPTQAQMIKFDGTNAAGLGDEFGHITASTTNDELTVGAADGIYELGWFASLSAQGGASREVILNLGVELFTPISVTGATGDTISPIVLTISGLLGTDGLLIEIVDVGGNTAANGSWIINASTSTTIELYSLNRIASTGNGTYVSDTGELSIYYPSFNLAHTEISQNDLLLNGGGSTGGGVHLNEGAKVALYASNLDGTNPLDFAQAVFGIRRISGPRSGVVPLVF